MQATITGKGQVTVPKAIRDRLHLHPGDRLEFLVDGGRDGPGRPGHRDFEPAQGDGPQARARGEPDRDGGRNRPGCYEVVIGLDTNVLVRYVEQDDPRTG